MACFEQTLSAASFNGQMDCRTLPVIILDQHTVRRLYLVVAQVLSSQVINGVSYLRVILGILLLYFLVGWYVLEMRYTI